MTTNILQYFHSSVEKWPDKIAISDDKESLSFSQWCETAKGIGTAIAFDTHRAMRQPILVFTDRTIDCLVGFMAVLESGNFYVPIDCKMPYERVKLIVDVLNPIGAIVFTQKDISTLESINFDGRIWDGSATSDNKADEKLLYDIQSQLIDLDPVYSIFTSGSTGVPKGVVISHRGMIDLADWLVDTFNFTESDALGNQTPFYFDGSVKDICICLKTGATLNVISRKYFSFPKLIIPFLNDRKITAILWATSAVILIGNSDILDIDLPKHLRLVTFAGEAMPAKQLNVWYDKLPNVKFANLYGPTEITVDCTYFLVNRRFNDDEYIPIGKECRNKQVLVLNEVNKLVELNEPGELCVRGSGVALGYYGIQSKSDEVFVQNPLNNYFRDIIYRTGDIAKYNEEGDLVFVSRKDFQVKHKGNRIELGEIEVAVNAHPDITNAACIFDNVKDKIVLYYTTNNNEGVDIINFVKNRIPSYMFPDESILLKEMPYSLNDKIDRIQLKNLYDDSQIN